MPHFGLMDARTMPAGEAALLRSRLHIRGGKRRLRQGKISAGIVTLYDALECALEWYADSRKRREKAGIPDDDRKESRSLYRRLAAAGIINADFDFDAFNTLTDRALEEELPDLDLEGIVNGLETVMGDLGILPFDEDALPPENPGTF